MTANDSGKTASGDIWASVADENLGKAPWALRIHDGVISKETVRLEPDVTYIGRMPENHVVLDDDKASRSHARITCTNHQFVLEDQQSQNGTFVNGKKVERHVLALGDLIQVGRHVLRVAPATEEAKEADREENLQENEEAEWRMDMTVSVGTEEIQRKILDRAAQKSKVKTVAAPVLSCTLKVGDKNYSKEVTFKKGKKRPVGDTTPDSMAVRIVVGEWVLEENVPL